MRVWNVIAALFHATASQYYSGKGDLEKARKKLDQALSLDENPEIYVLAYDARLMTREDRHREALDRIRECLARLPEEMDADQLHVWATCRFFLAAYDYRKGYEELANLAEQANSARQKASWASKYFLPSMPEKALREIFGRRVEIKSYSFVPGLNPAHRVLYHSDFDAR